MYVCCYSCVYICMYVSCVRDDHLVATAHFVILFFGKIDNNKVLRNPINPKSRSKIHRIQSIKRSAEVITTRPVKFAILVVEEKAKVGFKDLI